MLEKVCVSIKLKITSHFENKKEKKLSLCSIEKRNAQKQEKTFCFGSTSSRIWNGRRGQTEISKTFFPRDLLQQEYIYLQDWLVDFYLFLIKIASELKEIYHTNTQVVLSSEWIGNKEGKSLNWHETKNHVTFWKKAIIVHAQKVLFGRLWHKHVRTYSFVFSSVLQNPDARELRRFPIGGD